MTTHRRAMLTLLGWALATSVAAQDSDRWMRLGQSSLNPRGDRVEIRLRGRERIEALVLGVDNASVRILAARIQFANGRVIDWPIRGVMYPGQRTHVFQLPGLFERRLRRVVLYYETGHNRRRRHGDRDRPWDREMAPWEERHSEPREMDRDRGFDEDSRWDRNWDPHWERDYGRFKPIVVVWGRD